MALSLQFPSLALPSHSPGPPFPLLNPPTFGHYLMGSQMRSLTSCPSFPQSLSIAPCRPLPCLVLPTPALRWAGVSGEQPRGGLSCTEGDAPRWGGPTTPHWGGAHHPPLRGTPQSEEGTHRPTPRAQASPAPHQLPLSTGPPAGTPFGKDSEGVTKHPNPPGTSHPLDLPPHFLSPPPPPPCGAAGPAQGQPWPGSPFRSPCTPLPFFSAGSSAPQLQPHPGGLLCFTYLTKKVKNPRKCPTNITKKTQNKTKNQQKEPKQTPKPQKKPYYRNTYFEGLKSQT